MVEIPVWLCAVRIVASFLSSLLQNHALAGESCADVSRMVLESWAELEARNERIKTWLTFHDMLLTGMTWLYSRWRSQVDDHSMTEHVAQICSRLLTSASQGEQRLIKYVRSFNRAH